MARWTANTGRVSDASALVQAFHYSRRMPANIQLVVTWHNAGGLFGDGQDGEAIAACIFSIPPTRWAEPVIELSRLVRRENVDCSLTGLIATACKLAKAQGHHLLVSFADWTQKHHGGIYQAASWHYSGLRERRMDGVIWNGAFIPGRSCNSRWGTRAPSKLAERLSGTVEPHYDEGKHCYWRAISKEGGRRAKRLGLECLPYPKPDTHPAEVVNG